MARADLDDPRAALGGQRVPGRVLVVRDQVQKLRQRLRRGERGLQRLGNDAVRVRLDRQIARLARVEGLDRAEVRGVLERHDVARVEEHPAVQVETLLRAAGDDDVVRVDRDAVLRANALGGPRAQLGDPVGDGVLERCRAARAHDLVLGRRDVLDREELGRGEAAAERDHLGVLSDLQHLADRRGLQPLGPAREARRREDDVHAGLFPFGRGSSARLPAVSRAASAARPPAAGAASAPAPPSG